MLVLLDHEPIDVAGAADLRLSGLIEQVRKLAAANNRVLANIAIEGQSVNGDQLNELLKRPCKQIEQVEFETADPRAIALQALGQVAALFDQCKALEEGAIEMLSAGNMPKAMERLAGCLGLFKAAQEAVSEAVRINRLDLEQIALDEQRTIEQAVGEVSGRLGELKAALEARDLVLLRDLLTYEFPNIAAEWQAILATLDRHLAG